MKFLCNTISFAFCCFLIINKRFLNQGFISFFCFRYVRIFFIDHIVAPQYIPSYNFKQHHNTLIYYYTSSPIKYPSVLIAPPLVLEVFGNTELQVLKDIFVGDTYSYTLKQNKPISQHQTFRYIHTTCTTGCPVIKSLLLVIAGHTSHYTYGESLALFHTSCISLESLAHILGRKILLPFQETCFFFLTAVNATVLALSHRNRCVLTWHCLLGRAWRGRSCQLHHRLLCPTINSQCKHESIPVATVHSFIHAHDMYVLAPVNDTQGYCFLLCDSILLDHSSLGSSLPLLPPVWTFWILSL